MSRQQPEFKFQAALVRHIRARLLPRVYYNALPFGEYRTKATAGRLAAMGVRPGASDLLFLREGQAIALELKVKGGRQSETQKQFEAEWRAAGGIYALAFSMDEALALLEDLGLIRPDVSARAAA